MERAFRTARWGTVVAASAAAAGLVTLLLQAMTEVLAEPGLSLVDGYWIGRLPWTAVGVDLVVIGATTILVFGTVTAWLAGGPARRAASGLALVIGAFWWLLAMVPPPQGAFCAGCPARGPDPFTMAYSQPELASLFLLFPAAVAGAVALSAPRIGGSRVGAQGS
jgi:hypothetical protein